MLEGRYALLAHIHDFKLAYVPFKMAKCTMKSVFVERSSGGGGLGAGRRIYICAKCQRVSSPYFQVSPIDHIVIARCFWKEIRESPSLFLHLSNPASRERIVG